MARSWVLAAWAPRFSGLLISDCFGVLGLFLLFFYIFCVCFVLFFWCSGEDLQYYYRIFAHGIKKNPKEMQWRLSERSVYLSGDFIEMGSAFSRWHFFFFFFFFTPFIMVNFLLWFVNTQSLEFDRLSSLGGGSQGGGLFRWFLTV